MIIFISMQILVSASALASASVDMSGPYVYTVYYYVSLYICTVPMYVSLRLYCKYF